MTREEAIKCIRNILKGREDKRGKTEIDIALEMAIKALEEQSCEDTIDRQAAIRIASGYCHPANIAAELSKLPPAQPERRTDVLNEIRAEIEEKYGNYDICEWFEDYDYEENDVSEYRLVGSVSDILAIIDRYRAESEDT